LLDTILERSVELAAHLPVGIVGYADAAGLGDTLEPRRNIDAVAVNIAFLSNDIANISYLSPPSHCRRQLHAAPSALRLAPAAAWKLHKFSMVAPMKRGCDRPVPNCARFFA
jgi:hypothetical protein